MLVAASAGQAALAAEPVTAEGAMARYRQVFPTLDELDCPTDPTGKNIVVCGRRGADPNRLPLPVAPVPGARTNGEMPSQLAAEELAEDKCNNVGMAGACGGVIPILPFAIWVIKTAVKAAKAD
jgi:hypothetical protein